MSGSKVKELYDVARQAEEQYRAFVKRERDAFLVHRGTQERLRVRAEKLRARAEQAAAAERQGHGPVEPETVPETADGFGGGVIYSDAEPARSGSPSGPIPYSGYDFDVAEDV